MVPDGLGRRGVVGRQVLGPLPGGDDLEAGGAGPVHLFADQRRLVAVGEGIDAAAFGRAPRQQRPGQRVGLDIDHDHVAPVGGCRQGVADARRRIARGIDHHLEPAGFDQRPGVLAKMGGAFGPRLVERRRPDLFLGPARKRQAFPGAIEVEIGDTKDVQAGG